MDSHRSPAFVLSPYTRRDGFIDSTMYNTTSMLRTMELILGMRPMTHFDAGARPMWNAFAPKPDLRPYKPSSRASRSTRAIRQSTATAARSARLDFSEADRDRRRRNERYPLARNPANTEPPAPVRSYFAR